MGKIVGNPFHEGTRQNSSKFLKQNLVRNSIEGFTQVKSLKQYEVATIQDLSDMVEERHKRGAGRLALLIGELERVESMRDERTQKTENTEFEALRRHRQKRNRAEVVNGGITLLRNRRNGGVFEESRNLAGKKRRVHDVANRIS